MARQMLSLCALGEVKETSMDEKIAFGIGMVMHKSSGHGDLVLMDCFRYMGSYGPWFKNIRLYG